MLNAKILLEPALRKVLFPLVQIPSISKHKSESPTAFLSLITHYSLVRKLNPRRLLHWFWQQKDSRHWNVTFLGRTWAINNILSNENICAFLSYLTILQKYTFFLSLKYLILLFDTINLQSSLMHSGTAWKQTILFCHIYYNKRETQHFPGNKQS